MRIQTYTFHGSIGLLTVVLASQIAACADPPDSARSWQQESSFTGGTAYYLYGDEPIYLNVDPSRLTVATAASAPDAAIQAAAAAAGLGGARLARRAQTELFDLVLPGSPSAGDAVGAAARLRADKSFRFVANAYRALDGGAPIVLHDRLVVHLQDGAGSDAIDRLNRDTGTQLIRGPQNGSEEYLLAYPPGVDPLAFALQIAEQPGIAWVDPDKTSARTLHAIPGDPYFANQYYALNTQAAHGVPVDINVQWAWDLTGGAWAPSAGPFVVAIIDDGVQTFHPDLGGSFVIGFDAFTNSWSSFGCTDCPTNPGGNFSHGTAVAGLIKAQHDNSTGLAGLAPDVTLLPIQVFKDGVGGADSQFALGIDAAWQNNAQVLSNSWGGGAPSNAITAAINRATTQGRGGRGSVVVFSGGNTSQRQSGQIGAVAYPAILSNVIAVGAIDRTGALTDYSPEGPELDIVAPSGHFTNQCVGDVVTIDLIGAPGCDDGPGGDLDYSSTFSGTSATAPQVAAVAAMVISRTPTLTEAQVRSAITVNADPWGASTQFGAGKLNAYRALVGRTRATISGPTFPASSGSYTYTASASGGVGGYTYQWSGAAAGCANGPSCSVFVGLGDNLTVTLTVTNGPDHQQVSSSLSVHGPITNPVPCPTPAQRSLHPLRIIPPGC